MSDIYTNKSRIHTSRDQKVQERMILKRILAETRGCGLDSSDNKYSVIVDPCECENEFDILGSVHHDTVTYVKIYRN